jgi:hypothetical protein
MYLLKHVPPGIVEDPRIDSGSGDNVLHRLVLVHEDIRNDELNKSILESLLSVFCGSQALDAKNKWGYNPVVKVARTGIYGGIKAFARQEAISN